MGKFTEKVAFITGGNSGIGLATTKQFVNEGAYVFITGRREPKLAAAVKEIGRNVTAYQETCRIFKIWIASSPKSSGRRASLMFYSQMLVSPDTRTLHDHGRALRLDLRHQCERPAFHGSEGAAAAPRWCLLLF